MPWNPDVYNQFKAERYAPFYDLLGLVTVKNDLSVIDLGCGTGELTRKLADALPGSQVTGIDTSAEMLEKAKTFATDHLHFSQQSIENAVAGGSTWDIVFSNAAVQWVEDHETLLPRIISLVKKGGQLAIQVPSNHHHVSHVAIRELAERAPYREALNGWIRTSPVLSIEQYARILFENGGHNINVFEKVYPHVLEDAKAVVGWTSGTALVPYMDKLPAALKDSFLNEYTATLTKALPGSPVFYPFNRTLMVATF